MSHFKAPPKKQLGQHFLTDRNVIAQILLAIDPRPGERLVEIGPGQGAITLPLLKQHHALTVIEFDRDLIFPLTEAARAHGTLEIIHRDVLTVDFSRLSSRVTFSQQSRGTFLLAFGMGAIAALLAGACVAPVVIQVVVFASNLYAGGSPVALALTQVAQAIVGIQTEAAGSGRNPPRRRGLFTRRSSG